MSSILNGGRYGTKREVLPKLTGDLIRGNTAVLTVEEVREVRGNVSNNDFLSITFAEFPGHEWTTNAGQEDALIALVEAGKLPDAFHKWPGLRIPMFKRTNQHPTTKENVVKLYPVDVEDFDDSLAKFDAAKTENAKVGSKGADEASVPAAGSMRRRRTGAANGSGGDTEPRRNQIGE